MTNELQRKIWNLIRGGNFHGYLRRTEGYPLTLVDCMAEYPVSLAVSGNTVQDGTPAPDNPVEVQGYGGRTVNLFDGIWNYGYINQNGEVVYDENNHYSNLIPVKANSEYTLTGFSHVASNKRVHEYNSDGEFISQIAVFSTSNPSGQKYCITGTTSPNASYLKISTSAHDTEIMLVEGTNVTPYEPYGYKVPVVMSGRNLIDHTTIKQNNGLMTYVSCNSDGTVRCENPSNVTLYFKSDKINISAGNYTLSANLQNSGASIYFKYPGDEYLTYITANKPTVCKRFDSPTSVHVLIAIPAGVTETIHIQVEKGSTATPYEPYHAPKEFPIYLNTPLYGNGDISDTVELNVENKTATLVRRYGVVSFDGSEAWVDQKYTINNTSHIRYYLKLDNGALCNTSNGKAWCNLLPLGAQGATWSSIYTYCFATSVDSVLYIKTDGAQTLDNFKSWLSEQAAAGTPFTVVYQLATPVVTDISDKIDWDSIPKLWRGTVIITADTSVKPLNISVQYYADKPEEVNN